MSDLLPNNSTHLERALAQSNAAISDIPVRIKDIWNPDRCPVRLLPWLAWALSVDEWDPNWSEERRRAVIKASIPVHKYKGTIGAVREALAALNATAIVQEWLQQTPEGKPYTFTVHLIVTQFGAPRTDINSIATIIERTKNLRSRLSRIDLQVNSDAPTYYGAISAIGNDILLSNYVAPVMIVNQTTLII